MRETYFAIVGLVITLLSHSHQATAQGTLNFVTLFSATSLPRNDDTFSSFISTGGAFPFGTGYVFSVSVSDNGYISMGEPRCSNTQSSTSSCSVVAPYGADINTEDAGTVRYTDFNTYSPSGSSMIAVSSFIRNQTGDNFYGKRMMVAEWNGVAQYNMISLDTNTFQGIIITDGLKSYAVFIYECGGMEWGGGEIGWRASSSRHVSHSLSGRSDSDDIGCLYSNTYSAIVYRLYSTCDFNQFTCDNGQCTSRSYVCDQDVDCGDYSDERRCGTCESYEFTCDNGECEPQSYVCNQYNDCGDNSDERGCYNYCSSYQFTCDNGVCIDYDLRCDNYNDCGDYSDEERCGYLCSSKPFTCDNGRCIYDYHKCDGDDDCGDNSDEEGCGVNVGLAVGLSVGLVAFILLVGIPLCIVIGIYSLSRKTNRPVRTRVVATTPSAGATTVVTSGQASTTAPTAYSLQPVYKDAQLSSQDAPPSYTDVTAFPQAAQGYNQYQPNLAAAYPQQQNTMYPPQNQAYPPAVPYPDQAYPPPNSAYPTT